MTAKNCILLNIQLVMPARRRKTEAERLAEEAAAIAEADERWASKGRGPLAQSRKNIGKKCIERFIELAEKSSMTPEEMFEEIV